MDRTARRLGALTGAAGAGGEAEIRGGVTNSFRIREVRDTPPEPGRAGRLAASLPAAVDVRRRTARATGRQNTTVQPSARACSPV